MMTVIRHIHYHADFGRHMAHTWPYDADREESQPEIRELSLALATTPYISHTKMQNASTFKVMPFDYDKALIILRYMTLWVFSLAH